MHTADEQTLDAEAAVRAALDLLGDLRESHRRLEARAVHVEAELGRANAELAQKVAELEAVLAAIPTGVVVRDSAGGVSHVNEAAAAILGCRDARALPDDASRALTTARGDGGRTELVGADGGRRIVVRRTSEVRLVDGAVVGSVDSLDDQTDLADAEDRMRRLTRAAALGTMVGGVAHEVRNPLHAISGFAELLQREAAEGSRAARHAARIRAAVADLEAIVTSMLGVAGRGRLTRERTPLRPIVAAAVEAACASRSELEQDGEPLDPPAPEITLDVEDVVVDVDALQLRQALRNLVANAIEAQPRGARVHVGARLAGDGALVLRVEDAGPGVPPDAREHLFDPFFTTRASGTGLGLAIARRIAELHGGVLECVEGTASSACLASAGAPPSSARPAGHLGLADGQGALGGATFCLRLPGAAGSAPTADQGR